MARKEQGMSDLRDAARQALEALENTGDVWWNSKDEAITALKAALEQPEQGTEQQHPARQRFDDTGGREEPDPVERLRFFCSLAMNKQNWLDVEAFFDDVLAERQKNAALEQPNECHWYQDGDEDSDKWAASCGRHRYFQLNDGAPKDNRMSHCCYCGKPLVEVPIEPEDNHD
jgi:hypothetical protein